MSDKKESKSLENITRKEIVACASILGYDNTISKTMEKEDFLRILKGFPSFRPIQGYKACKYLVERGYNLDSK